MNVYDEKMEALIAAALVDGVLTDKEKLVLFKKAQSMGIDLDEFEIILNARLYEMRRGLKVDEQSDIVEESEKEDVLKDADIERQGVLSNVVVEENNVSIKSKQRVVGRT